MRPRVMLTTLCIAWLVLLSWRSHLCTQEAPIKTKPIPNPIEGKWIEICRDDNGLLMSMLPESTPRWSGPTPRWYLWKITKETIEMGADTKDSWRPHQYTYKLNPERQEDAIDLIFLDEEKGKKAKGKHIKLLAIYFVKDDYLMICIGGDTRPKSFTSSKDNPTTIHILHRDRRENADQDSAKPKRKSR